MDPLVPACEQEFYRVFEGYFDLEVRTNLRYGSDVYSLDRMMPVAEAAGNPERHLRVVHVAGTKGKGSTSFLADALIRAAGRSSAVFSSPHLVSIRERFLINGHPVSYAALLDAATALEQALRDRGLRPTLFEIMTVLALRLFVDAGCEYAVVETGIGGLLDATNYIPDPVCCVITPVSFDHTGLLGTTIAAIAGQKAGIVKPRIPVVLAPQPYPEAEAVIRERAAAVGSPVVLPCPAVPELRLWGLEDRPPFLIDNFRTALATVRELGLNPEPGAFRFPRLPGRFECLRAAPPVVIDCAHNGDSARQLVRGLESVYPGTRFTVVLGVVEGKDVDGIFAPLEAIAREFILTNPDLGHKGTELKRLKALASGSRVPYRVIPRIESRGQLPDDSALLFTGSFFTASIGARLFGTG
jgi:dihydrofolate synthase/folylpolyglutamate synthase